ncbi:hypothetical protein AcW1_006806 [Taiwanofungus camphoratus]|nr:hypothetical protein AcW1_006806 [Antrodia cinnamomea]
MAPRPEDDWSDSDEEVGSDVETAVQLGIPDGLVEAVEDLRDSSVSRIGGHPAFLSSPEPPFESAQCKNCNRPMQLLVQMWCPFVNSPNDRAMYIWGCAHGACQRKEGSVRAWRGLKYNKQYADKLAKKLAWQKQKEEDAARDAEETARKKTVVKTNPFSMKTICSSSPFDHGSQVFGKASLTPPPEDTEEVAQDHASSPSDDESDSTDDVGADLADSMAAASLENSPWAAAPAYSPLYLSTVSEYLPPAPKVKVPSSADFDVDDDGRKAKDSGWAMEGYENSIEVDHAFERFTKRVGYEGEQCLRYELGGTPLPFSSDSMFDKLFPVPLAPPLPVTKPDFIIAPAQRRTYTPSVIPLCPHCKSRRVFECQLMPNLISVLKAPHGPEEKMTDEERRQAVLQALKGSATAERAGMEWGTCMIFSCEKDCANDGQGAWREEVVLVQWDD